MSVGTRKMLVLIVASAFIMGCFSTFVYVGQGSAHTSMIFENDVKTIVTDPLVRKPNTQPTQPYLEMDRSRLLAMPPGDSYEVGDKASFYVGDDGKWWYNTTDPTGFMIFTKRAEGNMSELWTCDDMSFFDGDPRNNMTSLIEVTDEQADYMVDQFDNVIYPTVTSFAGPAPPRDGENSVYRSAGLPYFSTNVTGRVMIMVFNMYDGAFWWDMPDAHYLLGYYEPQTDQDYDRNIVHIDNWDWANRTGVQPALFEGNYSFMIEGVLAHEYQHVVNDYHNQVQDNFLSEGCSDLATLLCGYNLNISRFSKYMDFMNMPDNSLTEWLDQGLAGEQADYAAAGLFIIYLYDHFGLSVIHDLIVTNLTGIDAVNRALTLNGFDDWNFERVFNCWRLANLNRADSPGNGLYNYRSIDLNSPDFGRLKINEWDAADIEEVKSADRFFGTTKNMYGYDTGMSKLNVFGTDYIHVTSGVDLGWSSGLDPNDLRFNFDGDDLASRGWQVIKQPIHLTSQSVFSEDFEQGGAMPGWETLSTGTLTHHPWYIQSDIAGNHFAVANAMELGWDVNPEMRELLYMTQGFSTVGYDELGIEFSIDCQMPWVWGAFCRVLYSVDGGGKWSELTNYSESTNQMGDTPYQYHVTKVYDLSFASGYQDVRLAFDYSSYNTGWWFAVDDIKVGPLVSEKMWWSGNGDQVDYKMTADLDLTGMSQALLSFDTRWSMDNTWDFGFVQVSNDGGQNWTSVANEYTTEEAGYGAWPEAFANLPGITGDSPFIGYQEVSYDLSQWAGEMVKVRFRYITDWALALDGWFIDNIELNGDLIDNANDVTSFKSDIPSKDIDWLVTLYFPGCVGSDGIRYLPIVANLHLNEASETVLRYLGSMTVYRELYILVSPTAGPADYGFGVMN